MASRLWADDRFNEFKDAAERGLNWLLTLSPILSQLWTAWRRPTELSAVTDLLLWIQHRLAAAMVTGLLLYSWLQRQQRWLSRMMWSDLLKTSNKRQKWQKKQKQEIKTWHSLVLDSPPTERSAVWGLTSEDGENSFHCTDDHQAIRPGPQTHVQTSVTMSADLIHLEGAGGAAGALTEQPGSNRQAQNTSSISAQEQTWIDELRWDKWSALSAEVSQRKNQPGVACSLAVDLPPVTWFDLDLGLRSREVLQVLAVKHYLVPPSLQLHCLYVLLVWYLVAASPVRCHWLRATYRLAQKCLNTEK